MKELLEWMEYIEDVRQAGNVRHKLKDILVIVLFATPANAEYYQTEDIRWLKQRKEWKGIKSIGMEEKTIEDEKGERKGYRYYISSLCAETEAFGNSSDRSARSPRRP